MLQNRIERLEKKHKQQSEQEFLGKFEKVISIIEPLPPNYIHGQNRTEMDRFWQKFLKTHPQATRDKKIRINDLEFDSNNLKIHLSEGIDFSDIAYTNENYTLKGIPESPTETYQKISNNEWHTRELFANAASVGAIVTFNPDKPINLLGIRSKKTFGSPGTVSLPINGYVDPLPKSDNLLIDNLFKEAAEETQLVLPEEISNISFIGPAQMRGKSCDLIWRITPTISYEEWLKRWKKFTPNNEFSGFITCKEHEMARLLSGQIDSSQLQIIGNDNLKEVIKQRGVKINPLIIALSDYIS
ncbi:MAG: hypothetical protein A3B89_00345 [Candidatus Buchananbacteria bacterium RIFCSPHIGHO2_02_FULL_40_13]|uniref:Nudix hydrolase domain-containing protein n=1 Tax=Candidatus Buchananbacteria bacterium RIFCSPLOWO2_01_FULL_39_33 TaxID=1797543 RepID=A0A1G1YIU7_9BACT|nr:MAG: hypothetical protein A3B89_00345 [Candidatus Buchananbacteria bacterium RIFCSPHIGHO2_02_FULL_40_13]OGY52201.1 MAG: hypothetical protein A3A02_03355 [Candidatus Buchananbacteria bacterium RIFCSPLOWO2_01_FULL_39_33]